jgi:hypothetical protein
MSDSGSSSKTIAGLRHGLWSAQVLFVDIVRVLQEVSKMVAMFRAFRRV